MKKTILVSAVVGALMGVGCYGSVRTHEFQANPINCSVDPKDAVPKIARAAALADLTVLSSDANAGLVQTDWKSSGTVAGAATVQRRIRFTILASAGQIQIKPQPQVKMEDATIKIDWKDDDKGLSDNEVAIYNKLDQSIRAQLTTP